jgi:hypothetical protein
MKKLVAKVKNGSIKIKGRIFKIKKTFKNQFHRKPISKRKLKLLGLSMMMSIFGLPILPALAQDINALKIKNYDYLEYLVGKAGYYTGYYLVKTSKCIPQVSYSLGGIRLIKHVVEACEKSQFSPQQIFERSIDGCRDAF